MSAIVFDVRSAERRLKAAGASEQLAEATADLMSEAVLFNLDALVTKDYLDARLDARFSEMDARFSELEVRFRDIDARFEGTDARINNLRTELKGDLRLVHALLVLLLAGVFMPQLQSWFGG
jgi:hypothetical protein